jgi:hypothetical protein
MLTRMGSSGPSQTADRSSSCPPPSPSLPPYAREEIR